MFTNAKVAGVLWVEKVTDFFIVDLMKSSGISWNVGGWERVDMVTSM